MIYTPHLLGYNWKFLRLYKYFFKLDHFTEISNFFLWKGFLLENVNNQWSYSNIGKIGLANKKLHLKYFLITFTEIKGSLKKEIDNLTQNFLGLQSFGSRSEKKIIITIFKYDMIWWYDKFYLPWSPFYSTPFIHIGL